MSHPAAVAVLLMAFGSVAAAQPIAESLHAPPTPMTEAARTLVEDPGVKPVANQGQVQAPEPGRDAQRERAAVWNSPEMRDARRWVVEYFRSSGRNGDARARYYLDRLSRLDAESMHRWLADLAKVRQQKLHQQITAEAVWRFEQVRAATAQQHQSRYAAQAAWQQAARSRSAQQRLAADLQRSRTSASANRRRQSASRSTECNLRVDGVIVSE